MHEVTKYASDVVEGKIITGKLVKRACQRHLDDLERKDSPYYFDEDKADRIKNWFKYCKHVKGKLARKPIELIPDHNFILGSIFGWVHKDTGFRRFRKSYVQLGRKNAKSTLLSGVALYMLCADREYGADILCAATKREQAKIVYNDAMSMAKNSKDINRILKIANYEVKHKKSDSMMRALSKDTKTLDGLNPHLGILDEFHAHPDSSMYDVIVSGMGQRSQPLLFIITTAGFNLQSPCYKEYDYCTKVLDKTLDNDNYFTYIAQLDEDDDIKDESNWVKANPLLSRTEEGLEYLRQELKMALDVPEKMRNFLTKNLNIWVDKKNNGFLELNRWKACLSDEKEDLSDKKCIIGVDLSKTIDLTSISFIFLMGDGKYFVKNHNFMPEDTLKRKIKTDKVPYKLWVDQKWITITNGSVVDYRYILNYIKEQDWKMNLVCYDPWNATHFAQELESDGFEIIEIRQGFKSLSETLKRFREEVYKKNIYHDGNPVLTWAINNAVVRQDPNENIMLDKEKSIQRIDPLASVINAFCGAFKNKQNTKNVYEERGMRIL